MATNKTINKVVYGGTVLNIALQKHSDLQTNCDKQKSLTQKER